MYRSRARLGQTCWVCSAADWPDSWLGTWVGPDGKVVTIDLHGNALAVTVRPGVGMRPYDSAPLLDGSTKAIEGLPAACRRDPKRGLFLEVEAGTAAIGPTYRLYAAVESLARWRAAGADLPVDQLVLIPNTFIGLYDDFEDDLGVWWAYPLLPLQRHLTARTTPAAGCVSATP